MRVAGIVTLALCLAGCDQVLGLEERDGRDWLDGYAYRKQISITPGVSKDVADFPVSIVLTDADLARHAGTDGRDLVFTTATDQILDYEVVEYVAATGSVEAWVRVPVLSATNVTELRMYYGGAARPVISAPTWGADLEAVWHLSETGLESDSTRHGHGLNGSPSISVVPGIAGGARSYDGSAALSAGDPADGSLDFGTSSFSMSTWVYVTTSLNDYDMPLFKGAAQDTMPGFCFLLGFGSWGVSFSDSTQEQTVLFGDEQDFLASWVQLVVVVDRSVPELRSYANAAFVQSVPLILGSVDNPTPLELGGYTGFIYSGLLDETRIYRRALSADWIRAEYVNLARRSDFVLIGSEQQF